MKKAIAILIALCICISFCACDRNVIGTEHNNQAITGTTGTTNFVDPNGFNSLEELLDSYFKIFISAQSFSNNELQRFYPQRMWDNWEDWMEASLEDTYASIINQQTDLREVYTERYGEDYTISYSIKNATQEEQHSSFTQEEIEESYEIFGVHPRECFIYEVLVDITIKGSIRDDMRSDYLIIVRKIGNKWYAY